MSDWQKKTKASAGRAPLLWVAVACVGIAGAGGATLLALRPGQPAVSEATTQMSVGQLEQLYNSWHDPETGEPNPRDAGPTLRAAVDALQRASRANPDDTVLHRVLGEYLLASDLNGAAVTELRAAGTDEAATPLALALLRTGRLEELVAMRDAPPVIRSRAFEALGRYNEAIETLRQAVKNDPADAGAMARLGLLQLWHGDPKDAPHWLDEATRLAPDAGMTLRLRAEYAYAMRDFAGSEAAYSRLIAIGSAERYDPTPPSLGKARAQIYQDKLQDATATLDHAALRANDPMVIYYRALLAFRAGSFRHAGELAMTLVDRGLNYPAVYLLAGAAMLANGYPETAHHYLERYVSDVPSNSIAQTLLQDSLDRTAHPSQTSPVAPGALYAALGFPVP